MQTRCIPRLRPRLFPLILLLLALHGLALQAAEATPASSKSLAYLVSDIRIPFWDIMARGIRQQAQALGYELRVLSADNQARQELENAISAIRQPVDGIILSPTNSSAAVTLLKLAEDGGIPVVISDIGADSDNYVSFISSDNQQGAYEIGRVLVERMQELDWQQGRVGIIAIPQKRANGQARTQGFLRALEEAGIQSADIRQQRDFSHQETYDFSRELIAAHPDLRAIWLQGSDRYQAALDAIRDSGRTGEVLLICFDAEPAFIDLIPQGVLVGAAMQQPFLMGEMALQTLHDQLQGKPVKKQRQLPILAISARNIAAQLPIIRRNVLGQAP
ncbi:substrate-binding domain-containing protein [Magnetovirga frankeli]|uniref:substrate-binding domain-containing protein n=1 Tax=Magnetovirga frankeli TaxID=947516 RepID=UPI001293589F|nr:substrate-binding domain-containing protein [gamma proteobacterium SS-5]